MFKGKKTIIKIAITVGVCIISIFGMCTGVMASGLPIALAQIQQYDPSKSVVITTIDLLQKLVNTIAQ